MPLHFTAKSPRLACLEANAFHATIACKQVPTHYHHDDVFATSAFEALLTRLLTTMIIDAREAIKSRPRHIIT